MFKSKYSQLIELIIPATIVSNNQNIFFQNQPQLQSISDDRKIFVQAIETYSSAHLSGSPLTSGNAVATPADIINGVLTINVFGTELLNMIPLADMVSLVSDTGATFTVRSDLKNPYMFRDLYQIDWTKTYVKIINAPAGVLPRSYLFKVHYCYDNDIDS
jgi:hypothetical protein